MEDSEASGSGDVPGWVQVPGKCGWKQATKVCPCIVSVLSHTARCLFNRTLRMVK